MHPICVYSSYAQVITSFCLTTHSCMALGLAAVGHGVSWLPKHAHQCFRCTHVLRQQVLELSLDTHCALRRWWLSVASSLLFRYLLNLAVCGRKGYQVTRCWCVQAHLGLIALAVVLWKSIVLLHHIKACHGICNFSCMQSKTQNPALVHSRNTDFDKNEMWGNSGIRTRVARFKVWSDKPLH